ncbi:TIGR01244 family sulfur transferase [Algihabitans albus]|uniref:TIGR01244 family sulfur transferase n=1 Tax=Algihabitans albus TaxID=2164067 RepID=UPI000E5D8456|nr:TIGR01244 family sulfur transferase [Algihabitans albus]
MVETKRLDDKVYAGGQIGPDDIEALKADGFTAIVNNRPDGEGGPEQPTSDAVRAAAEAAGLAYSYVPMTAQSLSPETLEAFHAAVQAAPGKVLAHCRSGARSTALWALAEACHKARDVEAVIAEAGQAGYDLSQMRPMLQQWVQLHEQLTARG